MDERPWQRIIVLALTAGMLAAMGWLEMPPWQRELIRRGIRRQAYRLLHRAARASGHRAMGDELAGRVREADAGYAFTYRINPARYDTP